MSQSFTVTNVDTQAKLTHQEREKSNLSRWRLHVTKSEKVNNDFFHITQPTTVYKSSIVSYSQRSMVVLTLL